MRRVFKNLKVAVQRKQNFRKLAITSMGSKKVQNGNLMKACFDVLR